MRPWWAKASFRCSLETDMAKQGLLLSKKLAQWTPPDKDGSSASVSDSQATCIPLQTRL